jgi:hypothetical protein
VHRKSFDPDTLRVKERPRHEAALPRTQWADQPFVWDGNGRIIAPWPSHGAMTPDDERRLLCVLDSVRAAPPDKPCCGRSAPSRSRSSATAM